jgi:hypothetical protein
MRTLSMNDPLLGCVPYSLVEVYRPFGGTYCLHLQGRRVSHAGSKLIADCLTTSLFDLRMEIVLSSETLIDFYKTTWRRRREQLKSRL